jgi:hypothetical protein
MFRQTKVEWGWVSKQSTRNKPGIKNKRFLKIFLISFILNFLKERMHTFFSILKIENKIKTLFFNCEKF